MSANLLQGIAPDGTIRAIAVGDDGSLLTNGQSGGSLNPSITLYPHTDTFSVPSNGYNSYGVQQIAKLAFQVVSGSDISYRYKSEEGIATKNFYPLSVGQEESEDFGQLRFSGLIEFRNSSASNAEIAIKTWGDINSYGLD